MESLEISAKTVEEAIQRAVEQLGVSREEVEVTVVKEGKPGILGLGTEETVVKVKPLVPVPEGNRADSTESNLADSAEGNLADSAEGNLADSAEGNLAEAVEDVLERLLSLLGVDGAIMPLRQPIGEGEEKSSAVAFDIKGGDLGILIGRRGQTLSCLQYIVRLILGQRQETWVPIVIDVEGYKQRRYQALQTLARQVAEHVESRGAPFTFRSMPAYERRIVHLTLADYPDVITESIGQDEARRVVVLPKGQ